MHADGVTEDEVTRARALIETSFVMRMQSAAERADQLSRFATYFGDATLINEQVARYAATTTAAVSALARERKRYAANPTAAMQALSVGESLRDNQVPPPEHAAWMQVASLILNLSEVVTRN
jgi:predicted Zn-dependent peptidase